MTLFIDTHSSLITIALKTQDNNIYIKTKESDYSHSIYTMNMIDSVFKEANSSIKDLDSVIVVNGPGSFTGIRIGLTIAKTICYALNIKINTISSLDAYLISDDSDSLKMAVIEENNGYFIKVLDGNKIILDESYVSDLPSYDRCENNLNVGKIFDYFKDATGEPVHSIKANYIKKISVEE